MPDNTQVRSVTARLRADFSQYDAATNKSAATTTKATAQMVAATNKAAAAIDTSAKKISGAQKQTAADVQRSSAAVEKAAAKEKAAAEKAAAAAERAAERKATAAEKAAAREAAAVKKAAAEQERAAAKVAAAEKASARAAKQAADQRHAAMTDLGTTAGMASAGVLAATGLAIKSFMDFEQQMSRVGAAADADAAALDRLTAAALEAGKSTKYSATEAAQAEEELSKAGLSVAEIVGGGLQASMALAAAGHLELGEAAETAAITMKTFSLSAQDVPAVADALAAGAGKAVGSVGDLSYALKMSGLVADQLGMSMTDTVGTLAAFAQNALLGSDAGTSLKTMLSFLQPKSDDAAQAMRELGFEFYDANGKFVGIVNVAGQLQEKLSGLTQEQRMSTMHTIFGSDAIRAANVLYKEGSQGIATWIDAVEDQGYAARVAAKAQDNLRGDIEKLGGAIETALIESGGGGASGLRELTQAATMAVDVISELPPAVSNTAVVVGLVAGAAGLAAAGFLKVLPAIAETRAAMATLNITAATTRTRLTGIAGFLGGPWGIALAVGTIALGTWIERQQQAAEASRALREALDQQSGAMTSTARQQIQDALSTDQPGNKILPDWLLAGEDTRSINARAKELGLSLREVQAAAEGSGPALAGIRAQLAQAVRAGDLARVEQLGFVLDYLTDASSNLGKQRSAVLLSKEAMGELGAETGATAQAVAGYSAATVEATGDTQDFIDAEKELYEALDAANNAFLSGRAAERDYQESLDSVKEKLEGITDAERKSGKALDEHTEKGRENQEVMDSLAKDSLARLQNVLSDRGPGEAFERMLSETRSELIRVGMRFGMTRDEAEKYAKKVLNIPRKAITEIRLRNVEKAKRQAQELYNAVRSMPMKKTITLTVREVYENYGGESAARARYGSALSGAYSQRRTSPIKRAAGGLVPLSAGSGTADDVPALLTAGEYVVPRKPAQEHLPLLKAITAGARVAVQRFASGGAVAVPRVSVSGPRVVQVPVTETHTTTASVHVGQVVTGSPQQFATWGLDRAFSATGGVR